MLHGRRILLIIGGGIAAYKSLELIRMYQKHGAKVSVIMTRAAHEFVTPMSVSVLADSKVLSNLFDLTDESEIGHIQLSRSADLIVVAPATADLMAKMALGIAGDLASTVLLATDTPVLIVPAMNVRMWEHCATQRNIDTLRGDGIYICGPDKGDMACGEYGFGRMSDLDDVFKASADILVNTTLKGKRVLITSGSTHEPIDSVRYMANRSSGKQGVAIANAMVSMGADVCFVTGPSSVEMPQGCEIIHIQTAQQMMDVVQKQMPCDVAIFVAAVADWRVSKPFSGKIKKAKGRNVPEIKLSENPDILAYVSALASNRPPLVIGFAAETDHVLENAMEKFKRKGCDWLLANDVSPDTDIMGGDENTITMITKTGYEEWPRMSKQALARQLAQKIVDTLV